jgi:capsular polysaccharide biosynthesis protein
MNLDIVFEVIRKRWMQAFVLVFLATLVTGTMLYLQKPYFRSSAVFTAANPNLGDRSNIYRTEFWEQYFYYGGEFDNDRMMALARSEEMCRFMVDSFDLIKHYKINATDEKAGYLADYEYKENIRIHKNEFGHVKVNVWDTDKKLAAAIANAIVARTNAKSIASSNNMKLEILRKLQHDFNAQKDSLQQIELQLQSKADALLTARKADIIARLNETEKLIQQFNTSVNEVSALFVIEEALPALKKDKPKVLAGMIMAAIVSFIFSVLLLLFVEWRSRQKAS